jgi:hypothetical protein
LKTSETTTQRKYQFALKHSADTAGKWKKCVDWLEECKQSGWKVTYVQDLDDPTMKWRGVRDFNLGTFPTAKLQFGPSVVYLTLENPAERDRIRDELVEIFDQSGVEVTFGDPILKNANSSALPRLLELAANAPPPEREKIVSLVVRNVRKKGDTYTWASASANMDMLKDR